jgi:glutamate N-acetyltransferase/amino-acid N-acetyltransferase
MIGPKMATMLAIVVTDAPLDLVDAQRTLQGAANRSFNCISVEGAHEHQRFTGAVGRSPNRRATRPSTGATSAPSQVISTNCVSSWPGRFPDDGEGATHLIEIHIRGANTDADADAIARSVALE